MEETAKEFIEVNIEGHKYSVRSDLHTEEIHKLAQYVDAVMREIRKRTPTMTPTRMAVLAALNIAEELFRVRENCAEAAQKTTDVLKLIDQKLTTRS